MLCWGLELVARWLNEPQDTGRTWTTQTSDLYQDRGTTATATAAATATATATAAAAATATAATATTTTTTTITTITTIAYYCSCKYFNYFH